ncbi:MAG TPA: SDR family NAD(P)-dependent oxidoreductase [Rhodocyclaceae bacterium]|nr:SDR family NAD(P)-dependent oxidoreductase [Rhodocyclaceae bacterium]
MPLNVPIRDWRGKRVWIVGASSGIGAALAERLAARGARLALSARSAERLEALAAQLPGALVIPMDVTHAAAHQAAVDAICAAWGGVDVVVFNAGTYRPLRAWDLTSAIARETLETNLLGVFDGLAAVLPKMLTDRSGAVVLVGSVAGYGGLPNALVYGPSKAALINLAECLHLDLAARGISVFLVNPGFVATALTAQNDFHMPALIQPGEAAQRILTGLSRGEFEIHFPKRFTRLLKVLRFLPRRAYFWVVRRATGS